MIWIFLLAIVIGMTLDLAFPVQARGALSITDQSVNREIDPDPWIDLGGES